MFEDKSQEITEAMLDGLRASLSVKMSPKRYRHTCEVEKMAVRLGELYLPEKIALLRGAALLHDLTKELKWEQHEEILREHGISLTEEDFLTQKTLHARTAALLIPEQYPAFATEELILCVRYHTTGRAGMSLAEKLIYLADYIDLSRSFEDCVRLREIFFGAAPSEMAYDERLSHLRDTLILSLDMTVSALVAEGKIVSAETFAARNELLTEKAREIQKK